MTLITPIQSRNGLLLVKLMTISPSTSKFKIPTLSERERTGLQDYWKIYEQHRTEVDADLWRMIIAIPQFRKVLGDRDLSSPEQQENVERQRQAIYRNEWEPFLSSLWEQGQLYALVGVGFRSWFEIVSAFRKLVRPHILEAYRDSPERLLAALDGVDVLLEVMMSTIGDSYLEAMQGRIQQQEQTIQNAIERERMDAIFHGLLESAPDAIVVVNSQGTIELVNNQLERLFGYARDELLGQSVERLVPERFHEKHSKNREQYVHEPRVRPMGIGLELFGRRKDQAEFPVEISLSPLETSDGTLISAAIRDVTERRKTEEKIRELNQDLEQRASQLESANRELEAFSYSVSHDLRAPLRTIDGFSQALLEDFGEQLPDEGQNYLMRIRTAAQRMAQLIDDLLNLSRLSRAPLNPEPTNLSKIAQQVLQNLQRESPDRFVNISIEPNIVADCDPRLIKGVFENLLSNAWKFTSKEEMAQIEFRQMEDLQNGHVYFVRDNGAGFDMAYVNKLFGAFQRLHTNSEFPGTGIGLAIVQRIINRHGGRIWAEGVVNGGATFYFTL
jgi:PAS domain S-box-containing protein